ncbi:MAG: UDP-2,3-diacylglucosamine diphosphatase [Crocinitomicaceae bacterium]|nr:UDP-2,3-diacylglucosamine diphosphatase [Crocinitomicaceae bacterium]
MTLKRKVEVAVISDVHLGTYGSNAKELVNYLESIEPEILVLNGDIIDIWQFNKRYFPKSHMKVIQSITNLLTKGTKIHYITGNHDEMFRKFANFSIGNFHIQNKLVLKLESGTAWVFHGDVFDTTMKHSKWVAKLGGKGYDLLILLNTCINWISVKLGREKISLSKKVKDSVKGIIKYVNNFENTAAEIAIENGYDYVVCGHIHQPQIKKIAVKDKEVTYLNSGDWVENATALEYSEGKWTLYKHQHTKEKIEEKEDLSLSYAQLFEEVIEKLSVTN